TYTVILTATNGFGSDSETKSDYIVVEDAGETFTDSRDGKAYKWVQIGDQVWMAENLAYLPSVSPPTQESRADPYYYVYGYYGYSVSAAQALANYSNYGTLYNWAAAMDGEASSNSNPSGVQGVCPSGWHLPSDAEWDELIDHLGGETVAGGKLKETGYDHWQEPNEDATNSSGFSALPGGAKYYYSGFDFLNKFGKYWSATEASTSYAWPRMLHYSQADIWREATFKEDGLSVRCVKD
ncbi:MAG: fibrobacter succinogenes major paralogous domain-containing protein, partial [Bacteroidales bacterium]|nr:fibrobacter succinogenes major paralogous domain-containing protein [Bacteroidales bacterium]